MAPLNADGSIMKNRRRIPIEQAISHFDHHQCCIEAYDYLKGFDLPSQAWKNCRRGDWLVWMFERHPAFSKYRLRCRSGMGEYIAKQIIALSQHMNKQRLDHSVYNHGVVDLLQEIAEGGYRDYPVSQGKLMHAKDYVLRTSEVISEMTISTETIEGIKHGSNPMPNYVGKRLLAKAAVHVIQFDRLLVPDDDKFMFVRAAALIRQHVGPYKVAFQTEMGETDQSL
jgi:hypothetical protein